MADFRDYGILPEKGRQYEEVIYVMALIYNIINNEASNYLARFDLTPAKFNILMVIKYSGKNDGLTQVEIGKRLIVSAGNITKILDRLSAQGFITRAPSKTDRRANVIKITKIGSDTVEEAWGGYDAILKKASSFLTASEQKNTAFVLKKWFNSLIKGA
ncbi:Transcriptional regulator [Elusimicrobium minutum Pei191]|uniref:Transcriptional regulator n=1 Tax=Elusimicrobium minutum (strain Pei191) TaxID=445932 RepID=B2KCU2_ELUMP|nr:MarR family transcriptional regulator [Elusimicrobium minutum]ACC98338.1 Transcriptional regulator [Elusimicrobium minutum Pei191]